MGDAAPSEPFWLQALSALGFCPHPLSVLVIFVSQFLLCSTEREWYKEQLLGVASENPSEGFGTTVASAGLGLWHNLAYVRLQGNYGQSQCTSWYLSLACGSPAYKHLGICLRVGNTQGVLVQIGTGSVHPSFPLHYFSLDLSEFFWQ